MSSFNEILQKWFVEILESVDRSEQTKQRHKKVRVTDDGHTALRDMNTDVTFTFHQNQYPNTSTASVIKNVIGDSKGSGITRHCFAENPRASLMLSARAKFFFKPNTDHAPLYDIMIADFEDSFYDDVKIKGFIKRAQNEYKAFINDEVAEDIGRLEQEQFKFMVKMYIPPNLWSYLKHKPAEDVRRIISLIKDSELHDQLTRSLPNTPDGRKVINQFLKNRVATFGADLSEELNLELQHFFPNTNLQETSNLDKCVLNLFYNIKKALHLVKEAPNQGPLNISKMKIIKQIDRTRSEPMYQALVRTERAKIASRRAIHMYSSGLKLITKGLRSKKTSYVMRGFGLIYNVKNADYQRQRPQRKEYSLIGSCPLFDNKSNTDQINSYPCNEFRMKESAAAAILLMYMELVDYLVSPSPPLMLRRDMRVTAMYVTPDKKTIEDYDVNIYNKWSEDKKQEFSKEYKKFLLKYMNAGFTITDSIGPHGMPQLNLDSWGKTDVIVNPFRVREDTFLFKYFGHFRLEYNRLGIGSDARKIWLQHSIKRDYDPKYADLFLKSTVTSVFYHKNGYFPRPVFDINYYNPEFPCGVDSDCYSNLYFNVSSVSEYATYGPVIASARRKYINRISSDEWVSIDFSTICDPGAKLNPPISKLKITNKLLVTREAEASFDIHFNFRTNKKPLQMPFMDEKGKGQDMAAILMSDVSPEYQLYIPHPDFGKQGSQINEVALAFWKDDPLFKQNPFTHYITGYDEPKSIDRRVVSPAPPLFNRFMHPLTGETISRSDLFGADDDDTKVLAETSHSLPKWFNTTWNILDMAFPYPLKTLSGIIDDETTVFPIGKKRASNGYRQVATSTNVILPRSPAFWDLRSSLSHLMKNNKLSSLVNEAIKASNPLHKSVADQADVRPGGITGKPIKISPMIFTKSTKLSDFTLDINNCEIKLPTIKNKKDGTGARTEIETWFYVASGNTDPLEKFGDFKEESAGSERKGLGESTTSVGLTENRTENTGQLRSPFEAKTTKTGRSKESDKVSSRKSTKRGSEKVVDIPSVLTGDSKELGDTLELNEESGNLIEDIMYTDNSIISTGLGTRTGKPKISDVTGKSTPLAKPAEHAPHDDSKELDEYFKIGERDRLGLAPVSKNVEIKYTNVPDLGYGVMAASDFSKQDLIGYYTGKLMTKADLDERYGKHADTKYAIKVRSPFRTSGTRYKRKQAMYIDAEDDKDTTETAEGTWAKYINEPGEDQKPNVEFVDNSDSAQSHDELVEVRAIDDIKKGEWLTVDYRKGGDMTGKTKLVPKPTTTPLPTGRVSSETPPMSPPPRVEREIAFGDWLGTLNQ